MPPRRQQSILDVEETMKSFLKQDSDAYNVLHDETSEIHLLVYEERRVVTDSVP